MPHYRCPVKRSSRHSLWSDRYAGGGSTGQRHGALSTNTKEMKPLTTAIAQRPHLSHIPLRHTLTHPRGHRCATFRRVADSGGWFQCDHGFPVKPANTTPAGGERR